MKRKWTKAERAKIGAAVRAAAKRRKAEQKAKLATKHEQHSNPKEAERLAKLGTRKVRTVAEVRREDKETWTSKQVASFISMLRERKTALEEEAEELVHRAEQIDELIDEIEDVEL